MFGLMRQKAVLELSAIFYSSGWVDQRESCSLSNSCGALKKTKQKADIHMQIITKGALYCGDAP